MAVRLSDDFLEQIRDRNDIESVISSYVELKRRGRNLTGLCPFHLFLLCFAQRSAFCKKIFVLFVFFVKYLGYLYTRKVFGKIGVYIRCSVLYCAVCLSGKFTES